LRPVPGCAFASPTHRGTRSGAQGAICVTSEGLLYEHSQTLQRGPVLVDDSLYLRDQLACGDLVIVPDQTAATEAPRVRGKREE
jgi:hypothetical protein